MAVLASFLEVHLPWIGIKLGDDIPQFVKAVIDVHIEGDTEIALVLSHEVVELGTVAEGVLDGHLEGDLAFHGVFKNRLVDCLSNIQHSSISTNVWKIQALH